MARIPMGSFGQVVAQPGPRVNVDPNAHGAAVGSALAQAGQIGMNMAAEQMRLDDARAKERQRELAHAQDKADRITAVAVNAGVRNDFRDVSEEVSRDLAAGRIKPEEVEREFDSRSAKLLAQRLEGLRPDLAQEIQAHAIGPQGEARNRVTDAKVGYFRQTVKAGIKTAREELERRGITDRAGAVAAYEQIIASGGPEAGMAPDAQAAEVQSFRETLAANDFRARMNAARDNPQALDQVLEAIRQDSDLSPARAGELEQQAMARKQSILQHQQVLIARAEAAEARRERRAESAVRVLEKFFESGGIPDDTYMAGISKAVAGTSQAPLVNAMLQQAGERTSFALLAPQQQEQKIIELRQEIARSGNPALQKKLGLYESLRSKSAEQLKEDPLVYGASRRLIELKPLQFKNLDELAPQLLERVEQAQLVGARTGRAVSPLLASEASAAADMLAALPLPLRLPAMKKLADNMDPASIRGLSAQIGKKDDSLGLALYALKFLPSESAELILRGQDAVKTGRIKDVGGDMGAAAGHREIARQVAEIPWASPRQRDDATKAAQFAYDGLRDMKGSASAKDAIRRTTGEIAEWAGAKVPAPPGMDERAFRRALERLDAAAVTREAGGAEVRVGGATLAVDKLVANLATVRLIPAGPGQYALDSGGALVLRSDGKPLRIRIGGQ